MDQVGIGPIWSTLAKPPPSRPPYQNGDVASLREVIRDIREMIHFTDSDPRPLFNHLDFMSVFPYTSREDWPTLIRKVKCNDFTKTLEAAMGDPIKEEALVLQWETAWRARGHEHILQTYIHPDLIPYLRHAITHPALPFLRDHIIRLETIPWKVTTHDAQKLASVPTRIWPSELDRRAPPWTMEEKLSLRDAVLIRGFVDRVYNGDAPPASFFQNPRNLISEPTMEATIRFAKRQGGRKLAQPLDLRPLPFVRELFRRDDRHDFLFRDEWDGVGQFTLTSFLELGYRKQSGGQVISKRLQVVPVLSEWACVNAPFVDPTRLVADDSRLSGVRLLPAPRPQVRGVSTCTGPWQTGSPPCKRQHICDTCEADRSTAVSQTEPPPLGVDPGYDFASGQDLSVYTDGAAMPEELDRPDFTGFDNATETQYEWVPCLHCDLGGDTERDHMDAMKAPYVAECHRCGPPEMAESDSHRSAGEHTDLDMPGLAEDSDSANGFPARQPSDSSSEDSADEAPPDIFKTSFAKIRDEMIKGTMQLPFGSKTSPQEMVETYKESLMEGAKPHVNLDYRRALGEVAMIPPFGLGFSEEILVTQFSDASLVASLLKCTKVSLNLQCALLAVWPVRKELYTAMERNARSLGVTFTMDWVKPLTSPAQKIRPTDGLEEGRRTQELADLLERGVKEGSNTIRLSDGRLFLASPTGPAAADGPVLPPSPHEPAVVKARPKESIQHLHSPVKHPIQQDSPMPGPPLEQTPATEPAKEVLSSAG